MNSNEYNRGGKNVLAANGSCDGSMCVNNYNYENGKIRASIRWLITRIYNTDSQLPDNLREPFKINNEGRLELSTPLISCLTNGSFYSLAASRIFKDNSILMNNIGSVFNALSQADIDVRDTDGSCITEDILASQTPFHTNAHLILIDALMAAHLRSIVSIDKVVQAISNYTSIEKREEPLDCVDALLFWINKVCLLVRDDVERNRTPLNGNASKNDSIIPEMEDLYEDLCDGTCICTLVSFYRPNEISLQGICFNDPMSVNDCKFNLEILKNFCSTCLPWNPFPFEIDDILYLHESLQPNVNVFLADLFYFFESQECQIEPEPVAPTQPVQRRFVPIQSIPDLRGQKKSSPGSVAAKLAFASLGIEKRDRAFSMASDDSMMTGTTLKSKDSLALAQPRQLRLDPNLPVTRFGSVKDATSASNQHQISGQGQAATSSSGGGTPQKSLAEIRLQMDELRRQVDRRHQIETVKQEHIRNEANKDAFFRVMSRNNGPEGQTAGTLAAAPTTDLNNRRQSIGANIAAQQDQQQTMNQFANQSNLVATDNALNSHYVQQSQPNIMMRSMTMLSSEKQQPTFGVQQQQPFLGSPSNQQRQQTSTPINAVLAKQNYVASQHQHLSPIGPPPTNSVQLSGLENSFNQFALIGAHQQQQKPVEIGGAQIQTAFTPSQYFSQQAQQNFTPIPNGMPPAYQHQLAMAQHQPPLPPPFNNPYHPPPPANIINNGLGQPSSQFSGNFYNPSGVAPQYNINNNHQHQPLQPAFSQPSHLHLLHHQQQQIGGGGQINNQSHQQQIFQQPLMFNTPSSQHMDACVPQQQQQQYGGTPLSSQQQYLGSSTVFPSTETIVLPQNQSHLLMQHTLNTGGHQQQQMQMPPHQQSHLEEQRPSPFRLHQANAPASRLDPQLELNKDLTNWGITYRANDRPQRKTWAQKQAEQQQQLQQQQQQSFQNDQPSYDNALTQSDLMIEHVAEPQSIIQGMKTSFTAGENGQQVASVDHNLMVKSSHDILGGMDNHDNSNDISDSLSARVGGLLLEDASDPNTEMTPEMQAKRRALLASQIRRKERIVARSEEKDTESLERRQSELAKNEHAEQRKLEREQRRQKLLEDYKRKKIEQEMGEPSSARITPTTSSTISLNRGHSQPPIRRPKSQSNLNLHSARTLQRPSRTQSNMMGNNDENLTPRVSVPSIAEPTLKLYAKHQPKSNRGLIMNAIQYSIFPGHVSNENRQKAQAAIATSDSKHFLVLFRDHKLQYRALYTWDQFSDTAHKIEGQGPKVCKESMMTIMFKYDSGAKSFGEIQTKHLSATIDGFVIADQFWQKPKIPHSGR